MANEQPDEKAIFNAARQIDSPNARHAYLEEACRGDSVLLERIRELLRGYEQQASFLESPPVGPLSPTHLETPSEQPGTSVGPYKLLQQVGEGGMGSVWMAEQHEPVRRRVALKLIKPGMDSRQVLARFEAERQALSMMDHPNIAKVLDAGTTENGRPYFVMELVKGQPITQYCDEHHLTPRERLDLFLPVCHAIQHAHQKGVIHRDIKPSNVLVAEYDGRPLAKVIDFGVAKAVHQPLTEKTMFTGLGQIIGTLEYMSPEQARVNQLDIDTRSDVYSLGVLLYELLTGSTPFDKQRMREAALDELLRIIREEEPPRPSTKISSSQTLPSIAANRKMEPARLSTLVRGELDWIVMKALEKDRNRRYETANGFAMDIQRYLNDEQVLACPPSATYRFRKFARKNKAMLATTALVSAALILGLIGTAGQAVRAMRAEERAVANERQAIAERDEKEAARREAVASAEREAEQRRFAEAAAASEREAKEAERLAKEAESAQRLAAEAAEKKALEQAAIAKAVSSFLQEDLLGLAGAEAQLQSDLEPDPDVKLSTLLDRALRNVERRFTDQPLVRAAVEATLANALRSIGRYNEAAELWEKVRIYREKTLGLAHPDTLACMTEVARNYLDAGQNDIALPLLKRTVELLESELGANHRDTLLSMSILALAYLDAGQIKAAITLSEKILERQKLILGPEHPNTLSTVNILAGAYLDAGQDNTALQLFERTLELNRSRLGTTHPTTLLSSNNLALAYLKSGQSDRSISLFEQTLELQKSTLGSEHPDTLVTMNNLGSSYREIGQFDKALSLHEQTFELSKSKLGREHPRTLVYMHNLALVLDDAGQNDKAVTLYEQTLELTRTKHGPDHPNTLTSMNGLARAYRSAGQSDKALPLIEQTLELQKAKLGAGHPSTLTSMRNLALAYRAAGQINKALPLFEQTLEFRKSSLGPDHPQTILSMIDLTGAYQDAGQNDKFLHLSEQTLELARSRLGPDHPSTLASMNNLAMAYQNAGQNAKALPLSEQIMTLVKSKFGPDHPNTISSMNNLAWAYREMGQHDKSVPLFEQTLALSKSRHGAEHPETLITMDNLAVAYRVANQNDKALPLLELTLELKQSKLGLEHPETLISMYNLGLAYRDAAQYHKALQLIERSLELRKSKLGPEHPDTLQTMQNLAATHRDSGDHTKALELTQSVLRSQRLRDPESRTDRLQRANLLVMESFCLNALTRWKEAEDAARVAVAIRQELTPGEWAYFNAVSHLGESLLGQSKMNEAEPLLVESYRGLKAHSEKIPKGGVQRVLSEASERLVRLYVASDKTDEANRWREVLESYRGSNDQDRETSSQP